MFNDLTVTPCAAEAPDLRSYDRVLVAFSGGKDSLACILHLLDLGVEPGRIELHHHDVDGHGPTFMDWPCTPAYCRAIANALRLPLYFSWKEGGFLREMLRDGTATAPNAYETPGQTRLSGGNGPPGTRRKFPQVSGDLRVRWCSAYLKIDVLSASIRGQQRFEHGRTLVVTGERAEESRARACYPVFESHRTHLHGSGAKTRLVDALRPVHAWPEADVWNIIRRHGVIPHPGYRLGWGRLSCLSCIFGSANQWASIAAIAPQHFERVALREEASGMTIHRSLSVRQLAAKGRPYPAALAQPELVLRALSTSNWTDPVLVDPADWQQPAGAFGENAGPT